MNVGPRVARQGKDVQNKMHLYISLSFLIIIHRAIFNPGEQMEQIIIIYTIIAVQKKD